MVIQKNSIYELNMSKSLQLYVCYHHPSSHVSVNIIIIFIQPLMYYFIMMTLMIIIWSYLFGLAVFVGLEVLDAGISVVVRVTHAFERRLRLLCV